MRRQRDFVAPAVGQCVSRACGADDELSLSYTQCRQAIRVGSGHDAQAPARSHQFRHGGAGRPMPRAQHLIDAVQALSIGDPRAARDIESDTPFRRLRFGTGRPVAAARHTEQQYDCAAAVELLGRELLQRGTGGKHLSTVPFHGRQNPLHLVARYERNAVGQAPLTPMERHPYPRAVRIDGVQDGDVFITQCTRCPGSAPSSTVSKNTSLPPGPDARIIPSLIPNFIFRGARFAANTTRRPTNCSGV